MRDVQAQPLCNNLSRPKTTISPYPLKHPSTDDINFEIWDHLFLLDHFQRLTVQPNNPLLTVLDLGCGSGFWAIQAAKQWPSTVVIGYDVLQVQPDLDNVHVHDDVAHRIKWVHGNFFDGLPFSPDYFDLVHISRIGLGVPEYEWQPLLEEVTRVMKPGAVLEIIEEDPIFPGCYTPDRHRSLSMSSQAKSTCSSFPLGTSVVRSAENLPSRLLNHAPSPKIVNSIVKRLRLGSSHRRAPPDASLSQCRGSTDDQVEPPQSPPASERRGTGELSYPQYHPSHARLKLAWEASLSNRFIPINLLSVLPFYISTSFVKSQTHPQLSIPLPSNSDITDIDVEWSAKGATSDATLHLAPFSPPGSSSGRSTTLAAPASISDTMHLAKTVNTIKRCKDAIRKEYFTLFAANKLPDINPVGGNIPYLREAFEIDWKNWLNDMEDRIGMRRCLVSQFSWAEPPGDRPEWKAWREELELDTSLISKPDASTMVPACRSIRAFVAWKA